MNYQVLENFLKNKVRQGDVYVPSAIFLLLKNDGEATIEQIAKLIYIFENKHDLDKYKMIVENFVIVMLNDYSLIRKKENTIKLNTWPLSQEEIDSLIHLTYKISNGFFRNLNSQKAA